MIRRTLLVALIALVAAGAAVAGGIFVPHFNPPRQGQVAPSKVFWLQSRTYDGESGADTSDGGSMQLYTFKLYTGVVAHCLDSDSGDTCGFTQTGQGWHGLTTKVAHFDETRPGQISPVAVFWLQSRTVDGQSNSSDTFDSGSVDEYLLHLNKNLNADCLQFSASQQCVFTNAAGKIVSSGGTAPVDN